MKKNETGLPDLTPLARAEDPVRDLWPEIAASIGKSHTAARNARFVPVSGRRMRAFSAASLSAATLAAALVIGIAVGRSSVLPDRGPGGYLRAVNADYRKSERTVLYRLADSRVPEETVREIRDNLRVINRAAEHLMELVRKNPENRLLDERFETLNRERFEFLEAVRALVGDGGDDAIQGPSI